MHQRKDTKKPAAATLNHSKDNTSLVRVECLDDYRLPKQSTTTITPIINDLSNELDKDLNNLEKSLDYTVRRDISQDSLDEQTNGNHNDYIGINSTLNTSSAVNYSFVNKNAFNEQITGTKIQQPNEDSRDAYLSRNAINKQSSIDKPYTDKSYVDAKFNDRPYDFADKNVDRNVDLKSNDNAYKSQQTIQNLRFNNEHRNLINSNCLPPIRSANSQQTASTVKQFEVPVLIETPCTPEPPVDEESSAAESISEAIQANRNNSFENDSENNLAKRKCTRRRIENQEEIDALFNGLYYLALVLIFVLILSLILIVYHLL